MSKHFPKQIFVRVEMDHKETFLVAETEAREHAHVDETVRVAKYELVEVGEVQATASFKVARKVKRP